MKVTAKIYWIAILLLLASCADSQTKVTPMPDQGVEVGEDAGGDADAVDEFDADSLADDLWYEFEEVGDVIEVTMASNASTAMAIVNDEFLIVFGDDPRPVRLLQPVTSDFAFDATYLYFSNRIDTERWALIAVDYTELGAMPFWGQPITIFDQGGAEARLTIGGDTLFAGFRSGWPSGGSQIIETSAPSFEPRLVSFDQGWELEALGAQSADAVVWSESDGSQSRLRYRSGSTLPQALMTREVVELDIAGGSIFWVDDNASVRSIPAGFECFESGECAEPTRLGTARPGTLASSATGAFWIDTDDRILQSNGEDSTFLGQRIDSNTLSTTVTDAMFFWATSDGIRGRHTLAESQ